MKGIYLSLALFIFFASCSSDTNDMTATDAKIDSTVHAKIEILKAEMKAKNDSIINAMARQKADSILKSIKH